MKIKKEVKLGLYFDLMNKKTIDYSRNSSRGGRGNRKKEWRGGGSNGYRGSRGSRRGGGRGGQVYDYPDYYGLPIPYPMPMNMYPPSYYVASAEEGVLRQM